MHLSNFPLPLLILLPTLARAVIVTRTLTSTITSSYIPTSTPTAGPNAQYDSDTTFQAAILNSTNTYRLEHNATALTWNNSLAAYATTWAQKCNWAHSHGPSGENLAENYANVTDAVDGWGDERTKYDFKHGAFSEATGHFTQLVWKASTSVGCARMDCEGKGGTAQGWFVVCEYWPAGNVEGEFGAEVQREVETVTVKGPKEVVGLVKSLYGKINGAERRRGDWLLGGLVVVLMVMGA